MALPGHRRTSSDKRRRASHFALRKINLIACPKCKKSKLSHRVCASCGSYAGREMIAQKHKRTKEHKNRRT